MRVVRQLIRSGLAAQVRTEGHRSLLPVLTDAHSAVVVQDLPVLRLAVRMTTVASLAAAVSILQDRSSAGFAAQLATRDDDDVHQRHRAEEP
jgi:hypothetical protein